ncbi:MAG: histone deacetylase family protein [Fervidobacterium sp.]
MKNLNNDIVFCSALNEDYIPKKEIDNGRFIKNPERPSRLSLIYKFLRKHLQEIGLNTFPEDVLFLAHSEDYVKYIKSKSINTLQGEYLPEVFFVDPIFDTGTPISSKTYEAAFNSVKATLTGTNYALENNRITYVLTRPPGHHAMKKYAGGYCYFNNVAISARYLEKNYNMRVAILDIDFHHGNGTQDIFYNDPNVLYVSIHGDPKIFYPWYSGYPNEIGAENAEGTNLNLPLPKGADFSVYKEALEKACNKIFDYNPDFFILSFGTDTHINDPIGYFSLKDQDYIKIGLKIQTLIEKIGKGIIVHEGGYNRFSNLHAVKNFLEGLSS